MKPNNNIFAKEDLNSITDKIMQNPETNKLIYKADFIANL